MTVVGYDFVKVVVVTSVEMIGSRVTVVVSQFVVALVSVAYEVVVSYMNAEMTVISLT